MNGQLDPGDRALPLFGARPFCDELDCWEPAVDGQSRCERHGPIHPADCAVCADLVRRLAGP